jgi:CHAD domain-containing protein
MNMQNIGRQNQSMIQEDSFKYVINNYFSKYLEHFKVNLEKAMEEYDPEAIHEYRVSVKRIRAVIRGLDRVYDHKIFTGKMIRPLRLMFKAGGTIRDDQVQIGLVENIESEFGQFFPLIKAFYYKRIEDQRNSFFLKSIDFDRESIDIFAKQVENILDPLDDAYVESNLYRWLHESMEKLKGKRYDLELPDKLHRFRTRFKENGYVAEMIFQSKYSNYITRVAFNRMKNFGQELGNWHDHYQLWSKTAFIFQESRDAALLGECFELRKIITPIHDKLFQKILHQIKRDDTIFSI